MHERAAPGEGKQAIEWQRPRPHERRNRTSRENAMQNSLEESARSSRVGKLTNVILNNDRRNAELPHRFVDRDEMSAVHRARLPAAWVAGRNLSRFRPTPASGAPGVPNRRKATMGLMPGLPGGSVSYGHQDDGHTSRRGRIVGTAVTHRNYAPGKLFVGHASQAARHHDHGTRCAGERVPGVKVADCAGGELVFQCRRQYNTCAFITQSREYSRISRQPWRPSNIPPRPALHLRPVRRRRGEDERAQSERKKARERLFVRVMLESSRRVTFSLQESSVGAEHCRQYIGTILSTWAVGFRFVRLLVRRSARRHSIVRLEGIDEVGGAANVGSVPRLTAMMPRCTIFEWHAASVAKTLVPKVVQSPVLSVIFLRFRRCSTLCGSMEAFA